MTTPTAKRTTGPTPAFQFYPRDFLASRKVDDMSMTERGIYITLLSRCWLEDGLPLDMFSLARIARMKVDKFERLWTNSVLVECFYVRDGKLHNDRLDIERKKQHEHKRRQSDNGKKGGRPKKAVGSFGLDVAKPDESQPKAKKSSASASADVPPNPPQGGIPDSHHVEGATADAAGAFLDAYGKVYQHARDGAHYAMKPVRDFGYACQLVASWPDADYLLKMAELFLRKDAWKPKNEPGTVGQFLHMAPQCDSELRKHDIRPRASRVAS